MAGLAHLKRRKEFLQVAGARRKWVAPGLILQALKRAAAPAGATGRPPETLPEARIGFTASKKVGNAVCRNRARRRLRAAADRMLPLHAATGHDYVLIARAGTAERPFPELLGDLETALRRLGAYRDVPGAS
jgi:ribonuclease P protein component